METSVYHFWFGVDPMNWFQQGARYDSMIKDRFLDCLELAENGYFDKWAHTKKGFVSLIIVLDQFTRHIYRGRRQAYRNDKRTVKLLDTYLATYIHRLHPKEALFVLLPYQHSLRMADQNKGYLCLQALIQKFPTNRLLRSALQHQVGHMNVLRRFGRFPKRHAYQTLSREEKRYVRRTPHVPY